jgi:hypothetical protein
MTVIIVCFGKNPASEGRGRLNPMRVDYGVADRQGEFMFDEEGCSKEKIWNDIKIG